MTDEKLNLERAIAALYSKLDSVRAEQGAVTIRLNSGPAKNEYSRLTDQMVRLGTAEQVIVKEIENRKRGLENVEIAEKKAVGAAERHRKEKLLKKKLPPCEKCGAPTRFVADVKPNFRGGDAGWEAITTGDGWKSWYVELVCTRGSCLLQFHWYPDKPKDAET